MSNGINVNPLNAITKVYLDQIANAKAKETQKDIERWTQNEDAKYGYDKDGNSLNPKDKKKERWQDDDADGKWYEKSDVDGKISKREKEEKKKAVKEHHTKDCDDNCEPNCEHDQALEEGYGKKKSKKVKKESFSDWRTDLREIMTDDEEQKEIKEKNVKNKIKINPKLGEAIEEIGGEVLEAYTVTKADKKGNTPAWQGYKSGKKNVKTGKPLYKAADHLKNEEVEYDELDNDLLQFIESSLGNLPEDQILDLVESGWHRRNPGKKHPLESGSSKVTPRPVSDAEKKSTDKSDRMYVAMRRVKDRQKNYSKAKSDAADKLHGHYTDRQSRRKKGASPKEAAAQSHGDFGSKGFRVKRGGRKGEAPGTDRGTGNKSARRAGQEVKNRDPRKKS